MEKKSHQVLYRKYRPVSFGEVLGQEMVVASLQDTISTSRISHAYLFAGSRGTGKTSVARIFAREIGTSENDTIEIDAASNRGIDDVRALREGVSALPFDSKYKVYIIDEVHMLTKEAFNALLKTLEEPPRHVIFILATTEIGRLPETVVSRCQVMRFKKPDIKVLTKAVDAISRKEGYSIDSGAAVMIALSGEGSFRDTLGALERVIGSVSGKKIGEEAVLAITGAPRADLLRGFIAALALRDGDKAFEALQKAARGGVQARIFTDLILRSVRFVMLLKYSPNIEKEIAEDISADELAFYKEIAKNAPGINSQTLLVLLDALDAVGYSFSPTLPLEIAVAKICFEGNSAPAARQ